MKKYILLAGFLSCIVSSFGQQIPKNIQQMLDSMQNDAKVALYNYRIDRDRGRLYSLWLQNQFSYPKSLFKQADSCNLNLGMIYDNEMRDRIVELMRNQYREYELDTLMNRRIAGNVSWLEQKALAMCKFDTLQIFKTALDSFYINLEPKTMSIDMYKHPVLKLLQLDTTKVFKQAYQIAVERERERRIYQWDLLLSY